MLAPLHPCWGFQSAESGASTLSSYLIREIKGSQIDVAWAFLNRVVPCKLQAGVLHPASSQTCAFWFVKSFCRWQTTSGTPSFVRSEGSLRICLLSFSNRIVHLTCLFLLPKRELLNTGVSPPSAPSTVPGPESVLNKC